MALKEQPVSGQGSFALVEDDPSPVEVFNAEGAAPYLLTCEHASNVIPICLGNLGLEDRHLTRHIAWDIGADGLARKMSRYLDATLVLQGFSRLVIDCNRPHHADDFIPEISDGTEVPGNIGIGADEKRARTEAIHSPYHDRISSILDERQAAGKHTALVSIHSFTPSLEARPGPRPWDVGLLYNRHEDLSQHVHYELEIEADHLHFTFNEPYRVCDHEDYTIPVHGEKRGIPNMLFEVRNDHIDDDQGQQEWANLLGGILQRVSSRI